jgi:hypothetical protein
MFHWSAFHWYDWALLVGVLAWGVQVLSALNRLLQALEVARSQIASLLREHQDEMRLIRRQIELLPYSIRHKWREPNLDEHTQEGED